MLGAVAGSFIPRPDGQTSARSLPGRLRIALTHRPLPNGETAPPALFDALAELGHDVTLVRGAGEDWSRFDVLWINGNPAWHPVLCSQIEGLRRQGLRCPFVLAWLSEPLPLPKGAPFPRQRLSLREIAKILLRDARATDPYTNTRVLRRLHARRLFDMLVVSTPSRQAFLAERGIRAEMVPLGYYPSYGRDLGLARDIDVLFLGDPRVPRRRRLLARLAKRGLRVERAGSWFSGEAWGERRTRLLNRARILLNLQRFPGELAGLRMILGMANKALVVSEPIFMPGPYVEGTHWIASDLERMPEVIAACLADPQRRQVIVDAAFELVTQQLTLTRSAARIVDLAVAAKPGLGHGDNPAQEVSR
jgi:hypothetical protein